MRPMSPGEKFVPPFANLVDAYGLDPEPATAPPDPAGFGGAAAWYESLPGGVGPRFLQGVPKMRFRVNPFDHVVSERGSENPIIPYAPGRAWGNTGFQETGDLTESGKTALTGVFLLASLGLVMYMYSGQRAR